MADKLKSLEDTKQQLLEPDVYNDPEKLKSASQKQKQLEQVISPFQQADGLLEDANALFELWQESEDQESFDLLCTSLDQLKACIDKLMFNRMFTQPHDANDAYIELQAGSGGTEAQDWAQMLLRMYLRWCDQKNFAYEIIDQMPGEVAGVKSATVKVTAPHAYGWLKTENGVHRLVRKSPFDSGNRRHTSFASVFCYPEVDEAIDIEINPSDCRVDTYRASGAGGQHVNTTDSAIRVTHMPTGIVVQCQSERSQHQNKAHAFNQLRSRLYQHKLQEQMAEKQKLESSKSAITWGEQIRSYVLDQSRIKDLRTGVEKTNTQAVLDGDLDDFIEQALKQGVNEEKS